jgi:hypothetical protein
MLVKLFNIKFQGKEFGGFFVVTCGWADKTHRELLQIFIITTKNNLLN